MEIKYNRIFVKQTQYLNELDLVHAVKNLFSTIITYEFGEKRDTIPVSVVLENKNVQNYMRKSHSEIFINYKKNNTGVYPQSQIVLQNEDYIRDIKKFLKSTEGKDISSPKKALIALYESLGIDIEAYKTETEDLRNKIQCRRPSDACV